MLNKEILLIVILLLVHVVLLTLFNIKKMSMITDAILIQYY